MVLPFSPRRVDSAIEGSAGGEEPSGAKVLRLIQIFYWETCFTENRTNLSS